MTKSRKIGVIAALTLLFVLVCATVVPLYSADNANLAYAVNVQTRDEWTNTYNGTYYDNLNTDLVGTAFRTQLATLITNTHTRLTTYDYLKTMYKTSDADPNKSGNIIWFYTGTSASYNGSLGSSSGTTNREHVWAKTGGSTFEPEAGPGADAHHLRPTEALLNNARSNYGFGEVEQNNNNIVAEAGSKSYGTFPNGLCYLASYGSSKLFYPAEGYRGATARILFYMQVRWGTQYGLDFVDGVTTNNGKSIGKISDLMKWHLEEPPTDEEVRRNNIVANYQGNRNPFIDHPEYAEMIYCNNNASYSNTLKNIVAQYGSYLDNSNVNPKPDPDPDPNPNPGPDEPVAPTGLTLSVNTLNLVVGGTHTVTVSATPSNADSSVNWTTSDSSVATVNGGVITAVNTGTATITATSTVDPTVSASVTVTVITQVQNSQAFAKSVEAIDKATTLEDRYTAIKNAIDAYNQMTKSEKDANGDNYQKLLTALSQYNEEVSNLNGEFQDANNLAAQIMVSVISVTFMAIVAVVIKEMLGGK